MLLAFWVTLYRYDPGLYLTFKFRAVFDRLCQLYGGAVHVESS
jgi:hypothetical protein